MNRRYVRLLVLAVSVALVFTAVLPAGAANPTPTPLPTLPAPVLVPPLSVTSAQEVPTLVDERTPGLAAVSPDGTKIAYAVDLGRKGRQMCVFTLADSQKKCYQFPDTFKGYPYELVWSPDSANITFTEDPQQSANESDIWVFAVASGAFTDRTNDNVEGSYRGKNVEGKTFWLDYLPMWNTDDGMIYFWRSVPRTDLTFTLQLQRINGSTGEPELVRDLTDYFLQYLLIYDNQAFFLDGVSTITPDASKVAIALQAPLDPLTLPKNGVWVVDLKDTKSEPKQLANNMDMQLAVPSWWSVPAFVCGLAWSADYKGVIVYAYSRGIQIPLDLVYYIDEATGDMKALFDFKKNADDSDAFLTDIYPPTGLPYRFYSPWTASMVPAGYGNTFLFLNDLSGGIGIGAIPLPPGNGGAGVLYSAPSPLVPYVLTRSSTSKDGKVLMYFMLYQLAKK